MTSAAGVDVPEAAPAPSPMRARGSKPAPPVVVKENTYASYGRDDDDEAEDFDDGDFEDEAGAAQWLHRRWR